MHCIGQNQKLFVIAFEFLVCAFTEVARVRFFAVHYKYRAANFA